MEMRHRLMLLEARTDCEKRLERNNRAIQALCLMREHFWADNSSQSLVKAWVAEDEALRSEIHNYDEFLKL